MKRLVTILSFSLLYALLAFDLPDVPNRTFQRGEYLKFSIDYGFINAGYASLVVKDEPVYIQGKPCYHVVGKGWTNSTWDVIYKVRDRYESWIDQDELVSRRFVRHLNEGGFHTVQRVNFDQAAGKARYHDPNRGNQTYNVPERVQDVLSAFFFARAHYDQDELKVGDHIDLHNFLDRKVFALEARLLEREEIEVGGHSFNALKFDLLIEEAGLMTDGSDIQFWISDDDNKIPLRIESQLMIGSISCDLVEWRGLRHPLGISE